MRVMPTQIHGTFLFIDINCSDLGLKKPCKILKLLFINQYRFSVFRNFMIIILVVVIKTI